MRRLGYSAEDQFIKRRLLSTLVILVVLAAVGGVSTVSATPIPTDFRALPGELHEVTLSWTPVPGASEYLLERREFDPTGMIEWTDIAPPAGLPGSTATWVDDDPGLGKVRYEYQIAAVDPSGASDWARSSAVPTFIGKPLFGWIDVLAATDSTGDPYIDPDETLDVAAGLQSLIDNELGGLPSPMRDPRTGPHVLYFPCRTYRIDAEVHLRGRSGVQFIGESAAECAAAGNGPVRFEWTGPSGADVNNPSVMFRMNRSRDITFRNLIWDGGCIDGAAGTCYVVAFDEATGVAPLCVKSGAACDPDPGMNMLCPQDDQCAIQGDTGTAHYDSTFKNSFIGLRVGRDHVQDSEITIRRCVFEDNWLGVSIEDFNALNIWVWDSLFSSNFVGISNDLSTAYSGVPDVVGQSGGDFDVIRGRFQNNVNTDIWATPFGDFTFRDSVSVGSGRFLYVQSNGTPARYSIIGNQVENDGSVPLIQTGAPGSFLIMDNTFVSPLDNPIEMFQFSSTAILDLISIGNKFTTDQVTNDPVDGAYSLPHGGRFRIVDDIQVVVGPLVVPPLPVGNDDLNTLPVYTVVGAASGDPDAPMLAEVAEKIQSVLDAAVANQPAVVHFPGVYGLYRIDQTLNTAANQQLTLAGDGKWTSIQRDSAAGEPVMEIAADQIGRLSLLDLMVQDSGVVVRGVVSGESRVFLNQLRADGSSEAGLILDGLDRAVVVSHDQYISSSRDDSESRGTIVRVGFEPVAAVEKPGIAIWTGLSTLNDVDFEVVNDAAEAKLLVSSNYMETSRHHVNIDGGGYGGSVTLHSGKIATWTPGVCDGGVPCANDGECPGERCLWGECTRTCQLPCAAGRSCVYDPSLCGGQFTCCDNGSSCTADIDCADPEECVNGMCTVLCGSTCPTGQCVLNPGEVDVASAASVVTAKDYPGELNMVEVSAFIQGQKGAAGMASFGPVVTKGAQVRLEGEASMNNRFVASNLHPQKNDTEFDLDLATSESTYLRLSSKRGSPDISAQAPDLQAGGECGTVTDACEIDPVCLGGVPSPPEAVCVDLNQELLASVALLRQMSPPPAFYDEEPALAQREIIFDRVFILDAPVGLYVGGGPECLVDGECDDGIDCTADTCEFITGISGVPGRCRNADNCPNGSACDESRNECSTSCFSDADCDDVDACTTDLCLLDFGLPGTSGVCRNDYACDDGVECTVDVCDEAGCSNTPSDLSCDDGVDCTTDICTGANGCVLVDNCPGSLVCDEGRDECSLSCITDAECDDGLSCTTDLCLLDFGPPGTPGVCRNDSTCNDQVDCTVDTCEPSGCFNTPSSALCDDGAACTTNTCSATNDCTTVDKCPGSYLCDVGRSVCSSSCSVDSDCDDGLPCTSDLCLLDFGLPGTLGVCRNDSTCDDQIDCTVDTCEPSGCFNTPSNALCDDGVSCTGNICSASNDCLPPVDTCPGALVCDEGRDECSASCLTDVDCDDGISCTFDLCLLDFGLPGTPGVCRNDPGCDDSVSCTIDFCGKGGCSNNPSHMLCEDGVTCTDDICDPIDGCQFVDNCPGALTCAWGECTNECFADAECNDGDPCTTDLCIAEFGLPGVPGLCRHIGDCGGGR